MKNNHEVNTQSVSHSERFVELAKAVRLREGVEGIARALWLLLSGQIHSTHEWSRNLQIPVPVLAALRRELEKQNILEAVPGLRLTTEGKSFLEKCFSSRSIPKLNCPTCLGKGRILPPEILPVLQEYTMICNQRPDVDVTLDQSHATPETGIRKALLLLENGWLGRSILFLGDDDLISVACLLVRQHFMVDSSALGNLMVVDLDQRYLDQIQKVSQGEIAVQNRDVRHDWPESLLEKFDIVLTDPPYTIPAISTFAYRSCQALNLQGRLLLSMSIPDSAGLGEIEKNLLLYGCAVREIYPQFNQYIGASIHAHNSSLLICEKYTAQPPENFPQLRYTTFYTADNGNPGGNYQCTLCDAVIPVGPSQDFFTVQDLKKIGCKICGNRTFRRLGKISSHTSVDSNPESEKIPANTNDTPQTQ